MTEIVRPYRVETDDFAVEFEVVSPLDTTRAMSEQEREIQLAIQELDGKIEYYDGEIEKLDGEIDRLTNHADGLDYAVAVASGLITGLIDSFFGDQIKKMTDNFINNRVIDSAKEQKIKSKIKDAEEKAKEKGKELTEEAKKSIKESVERDFAASDGATEEEKKKILSKAIKYFEDNNKSPTDNIWNYKGSSVTAKSHHLDDLTHHASIIGLAASIIVQFTHNGIFFDSTGKRVNILSKMGIPIEIDEENQQLFGTTLKSKIVCGTLNWFWHLVSDVAGTSGKTAGGGMGVPGPLLSLVKLVSSLPGLKDTKLSEFANYIFTNDSIRFDFRSEVAQSIPVLMNDLFVRVFYSIRRFVMEYQMHKNLRDINWRKVLPFGNRTVARMLTIATGTFTAVDIADAAIRSGGFNPSCLLRVNFVGVGRFAFAIVTDVGMGIKREKLLNERIEMMSKQFALLNAKVSYKCAAVYLAETEMFKAQEQMWISAESTEATLNEVYEVAVESVEYVKESLVEIEENMQKISSYREKIEDKNPGLIKDVEEILKYGRKKK